MTHLVGEQQRQFSLVLVAALEHFSGQLEHGGNASAAGDHVHPLGGHMLGRILAQLLDGEGAVAEILQPSRGTTERYLVAQLELLQVLCHLAAGRELGMGVLEVHLDHEIDVANILVGRDGCVWPDDKLVIDGGD